ncbi:hydroxymethylbilane synthase [Bifidobacterium callitrichos]|uniref:Porphobilinogen deaminase n=1 Tax=Bifidobacterium callitrichos TaxID=762209 RepID=A0A5M9ZA17_9BIFI|nr:hydroxymethylbilane synthase [Bifidobacterium callitrichos]KAA8815362.1 hydroxymethylbilane synthase [Bifidobacterium callitrichos]
MITTFKVGTRTSRLAMRQTELVIGMLRAHAPGVEFQVVPIVTQGDRDRTSSLHVIGGKGVFVKEIERELEDGTIDFAAHSLKDVQPQLPEGLTIGCTPVRDSPFDCLIGPEPLRSISDLPAGARVGTNSQRRQAQLLHLRPDLEIVPIRGNIDTRIRKIATEHLDAIVLAEAGLNRLEPDTTGLHRLSLRNVLLPAAGQGAMAVECRADDETTRELLARIDDAPTREAVTLERGFMRAIGGNCTLPIGAYARRTPQTPQTPRTPLHDVSEHPTASTDGRAVSGTTGAPLTLDAMVATPDGSRVYRATATAAATESTAGHAVEMVIGATDGTATQRTGTAPEELIASVIRDLHSAGSPL